MAQPSYTVTTPCPRCGGRDLALYDWHTPFATEVWCPACKTVYDSSAELNIVETQQVTAPFSGRCPCCDGVLILESGDTLDTAVYRCKDCAARFAGRVRYPTPSAKLQPSSQLGRLIFVSDQGLTTWRAKLSAKLRQVADLLDKSSA